jgi:surface carbohydrate biosynthesis protein
MTTKVAFIVDNPNRDLAGLTLTALYLARKGIETHLIPMYDQFQHVCDILPDILVLNYVRQENRQLIKLYHSMGIKLAVLDTEGGVFINHHEIVENLVREQDSLSRISLYMVWGRVLGDLYTQRFTGSIDTIFEVTGVPRVDLYHSKFRQHLKNPLGKDYILLPTNHTLVNSRFNDVEGEISNAQKVMSSTEEIWQERVMLLQNNWNSILDLFEQIFSNHPDKNFVIRPHPFENQTPYNNRFDRFPNVMICLDQQLSGWLEHAKGLLHLNCSTGIEAAMIGKKSISFNWLQHEMIKAPTVDSCTYKANSPEELELAINALWQEERLPSTLAQQESHVEETLELIINDWFFAVDGKSHIRVAERIAEILLKSPPNSINMTVSARLNLLKEAMRRFAGSIYFATGARREDKLARRRRKAFSKKDVENVISSLFAGIPSYHLITSSLYTENEIYNSDRVTFH